MAKDLTNWTICLIASHNVSGAWGWVGVRLGGVAVVLCQLNLGIMSATFLILYVCLSVSRRKVHKVGSLVCMTLSRDLAAQSGGTSFSETFRCCYGFKSPKQ